MTSKQNTTRPIMSCDNCKFRAKVGDSPDTLLGKIWVWHTAVCPGWKRYVKARFEYGEEPPLYGHWRGYWKDRKCK